MKTTVFAYPAHQDAPPAHQHSIAPYVKPVTSSITLAASNVLQAA